jgi:uncharacterized protein (TIGR02453 family)
MIDPELLDFLRELAQNNNKAWFNPRKKQYKRLRAAFTAEMEDTAQEIAFFDQRVADALDDPATVKVFRIYRDVRFSNNKEPLKKMTSGFISPGGERPGYYLQVQPNDNSFAGGGIYRPPAAMLKAIRAEINETYEELQRIVDDPAFRAAFPGGLDQGNKLKTAPRGTSLDHPAIELLRLTSFTATRGFSDREIVGENFHESQIALYQALYPLNAYLDKALRRMD